MTDADKAVGKHLLNYIDTSDLPFVHDKHQDDMGNADLFDITFQPGEDFVRLIGRVRIHKKGIGTTRRRLQRKLVSDYLRFLKRNDIHVNLLYYDFKERRRPDYGPIFGVDLETMVLDKPIRVAVPDLEHPWWDKTKIRCSKDLGIDIDRVEAIVEDLLNSGDPNLGRKGG